MNLFKKTKTPFLIEGTGSKIEKAIYRDKFYEKNSHSIQQVLRSDLRGYAGYDESDIAKMRLISLDHYTSQFMQNRCNVYDMAPVIKPVGDKESKDFEAFKELLKEVDINTVFRSRFHRAMLHNTILSHVKYYEKGDKLFVETNYNIGTTRDKVFTYPGYNLEPMVICYPTQKPNGDDEWIVWDRSTKENYKTLKEPEFDYVNGRLKVDENKKGKTNPENEDNNVGDFWPWNVLRITKDDTDFWGNGFDSLVDFVRTANILLSTCQEDVVYNALSVWIYNFTPQGTKGEKGQLKSGPRYPWFRQGGIGQGGDPGGVILRAQLFVDEILRMVESLESMLASQYNVESILKRQTKQMPSGVSIRLEKEPQLRDWRADVEIVREPDKKLLQTIVDANNYYRDDRQIRIDVEKDVVVDYQKPSVITDEPSEYEYEQMKWQDGTSSPVAWLMKQNPEWLTEQKAIDEIEKNRALFKQLFGIKVTVEDEPDEPGEETPKANKETEPNNAK